MANFQKCFTFSLHFAVNISSSPKLFESPSRVIKKVETKFKVKSVHRPAKQHYNANSPLVTIHCVLAPGTREKIYVRESAQTRLMPCSNDRTCHLLPVATRALITCCYTCYTRVVDNNIVRRRNHYSDRPSLIPRFYVFE